jgi:GDP/UDP-N,N'-diacetylbacillosamine 2-epimerase (hydrolysing)
MGVGTINIGERQKGRISASSIINCSSSLDDIRAALVKLYDPSFRKSLAATINPYGTGGASKKIIDILGVHSLGNLIKKPFYDLPI